MSSSSRRTHQLSLTSSNSFSSSSTFACNRRHNASMSRLLFLGLLLLALTLAIVQAEPNKQNNKVDKSGEEQKPIAAAAAAVDEEEVQTCTVRVQVVKKVSGKCVRLRGGNLACQTDDYLDPTNEDCLFP